MLMSASMRPHDSRAPAHTPGAHSFDKLRRAAWTLSLFHEARVVLAAFDAAGVAAVALKGIACHARGLYADPAERPMNDVDLLVRPQDAFAAVDILIDLGFRPHLPALAGSQGPDAGALNLNRPRLEAYLNAAGDLNFMHVERPWAWIDLHWDLARCDRFRGSIRMSAAEVVEGAKYNPGWERASARDLPRSGPEGPSHSGRTLNSKLPTPNCVIRNPQSAIDDGIGFPVLVPRIDHEILYLAAHYAIFCRAGSAQTLEDLRRLLGNAHSPRGPAGAAAKHHGEEAGINSRLFRSGFCDGTLESSTALRVLARRWGVARALRRTLRDMQHVQPSPPGPCGNFACPRWRRIAAGEISTEIFALDTWRDRARWLRRVVFPSPAWLAFAYGEGGGLVCARHLRALCGRLRGEAYD